MHDSTCETCAALFEELSVEDFERILRINVMGVIHALKATTPGMLGRSCTSASSLLTMLTKHAPRWA